LAEKKVCQLLTMQETKNKKRFILLVVLIIAALVVFWLVQPENMLDVDQDTFQVEDYKTINRIELKSDTGVITLAFNGTRWRVNDRYDADGNMINVLFATLQQTRPKRPVGNVRQDSIYRHLMESGIEVSLFEGADLRERFFAGGNTAKTQAYFGDPSSKEVYVMTIPGYRVYVSGIFEMKESGWRDKQVFGFNWRNFKSLEADFPKTPSENFIISMHKDYFGIQGLAQVDTARLNAFLDNVSLLTVDEYIYEPGLRDSLLNVKPHMQLKVTDIGNRTYSLKLFISPSHENAFGIRGDSQVVSFSRRKIQPLLRPKSFFKRK
jgi:hypothetical protein